jgi:ketosteroid isomerase-like protein
MTDSSNIDLVRSIYAAHERGDYSSVEWAHSDIELVVVDGPSPGRWRGLAAMAESMRDSLSAWQGARTEAEEYRELDDERVLVLTRRSGRGKASGLELEQLETRGATIFHVRDGKVTNYIVYYGRDRALADLDLAPEGDAP